MSYLGSKAASGLFQNIIALMPAHDTYIESHLGSGAVMKRKPSSLNNIGIDIDSETLKNFNCDYSVNLINANAHDFLKSYNYSGRELIYCDPPYLLSTRTSRHRYRFEYTKQDHIELLKLLKTLPCKIIISGYPSQLYDNYLKDWNNMELQAMTRGGVRTEKLWFNYNIDSAYWSSYAGQNFTDRQRIKRKATRWAKNYQELSKSERLAILAAIMEIEVKDNSTDPI